MVMVVEHHQIASNQLRGPGPQLSHAAVSSPSCKKDLLLGLNQDEPSARSFTDQARRAAVLGASASLESLDRMNSSAPGSVCGAGGIRGFGNLFVGD